LNLDPFIVAAVAGIAGFCIFWLAWRLRQRTAALQEGVERQAKLMAALPDITFRTDLAGNITFANERAARYAGLASPREAVGKSILSFVAPEDLPRATENLRLMLDRPLGPQEYRLRLAGGARAECEINGDILRDARGTPIERVFVARDLASRRQAEEAQRQSEEQYRSLFENAVEGVFQSTPEGRFLKVNPAMARVAGFASPEEMVASITNIGEQLFVHPEQREEFKRLLAEQGSVQGFEYAFRCRNGSQRWVSVHCRAARGPEGQPVRFEGIAHDITERKHSECLQAARGRVFDQLTRREPLAKILATLLNCVENLWAGHPASILLLDESGRRLGPGVVVRLPDFYVAAIAEQEIGPNGSICGAAAYWKRRVVVERIAADPRCATVRELMARAGLEACWVEPIRGAAGQVFGTFAVYAQQSGSPREDDLQCLEELARLVGSAIERNRAEEALFQSEARYRELVENANSIILKCDREGRITFFNEYAQHFFGFTREEILGEHLVGSIVPVTDSAGKDLAQLVREVLANPGRFREVENENTTKHGRRVQVRWSNKAMRDAQGKVTGVLAVGTDITERKQAEAELQRLYERTHQDAQTRMELLREINHRVKNNLTAILGLLLNELRHATPESRAHIEPVLDSLGRQVQGLLHAHQLLSDHEWAPVPLGDLARSLIQSALSALPASRRCTLSVPSLPVQVSPRQTGSLALVLNELATNSVKYALGDREVLGIQVQFGAGPEGVELEYRDDGPGYPDAVLRGERLGVGLDLIQKLVKGTLRGTLTLTNDAGAVATLRIKNEEASRT
jgi:PAS domain S-box-containing protein